MNSLYETNEIIRQYVLLLPPLTLIGLLISFSSELLFWFFCRKKQGHGFYPSWTLQALIQWTAFTMYLVLLGTAVTAFDFLCAALEAVGFLVVWITLKIVLNRLAKKTRKTGIAEWFIKTFTAEPVAFFSPTSSYAFVVLATMYSYCVYPL